MNNFSFEDKERSFLHLQDYLCDRKDKFFIGRLSGNEPNLCGRVLNKEAIPDQLMFEMLHTAGIHFKSNDDVKTYVGKYTKSCKNCDILGVWSGGMYTQSKLFYDFLEKITPNTKHICAQALEPYYFMENDKYAINNVFKGKRVLIISSHKDTTVHQLKKHMNIHKKPIFDVTTEFHVYKPPQQNGGNYDGRSWTEHLEDMQSDLEAIKNDFDFDVALVSCGGFGMIICDYIHSKLDKSVIYVGGALQLYFGILGNRWRNNSNIIPMINDNWTNVVESDKPPVLKDKLCENQCYW